MYAYVRKYWLLIGVYILLGASGSVLSLGTSVVSRDLVDAVTGVKSAEDCPGGSQPMWGSAFPRSLSMPSRPGCPSGCGSRSPTRSAATSTEQVLQTNWESLSKYRSGDLLYRVNGDASMVANTILTFLPNVVTTLISFGGAFVIVVKERSRHGSHRPGGSSGFLPDVPVFHEKDAGLPERQSGSGQRPDCL